MVEWIAIVISVIVILLDREKINQIFVKFADWQSRKKYEREGKLFIKSITPIQKDNFNVVYSMLFFFFLLSGGISGLLNLETIEELGTVSTLTLSPLLLLSLRGLIRQQGNWLVIIFISIMFVWTFVSLGLLWGIITAGFFLLKLPVFWAGLLATLCVLILIRLAQYHSQKTWAKDL